MGRNPCPERPISSFLRKRAFSWSAWAQAHPTHCRCGTGAVPTKVRTEEGRSDLSPSYPRTFLPSPGRAGGGRRESAAPSGSRFRPLVPGSSRVFRARCSCAREPLGPNGRPSATAPGTHEPPLTHAPEPPLLLFSPHRQSQRWRAFDPWDRRTFWSRHCHA